MKVLFYLSWTEVEFGWGDRSDGFSFHLTPEDAKLYKSRMAKSNEYYSWYAGEVKFISVQDSTYDSIKSLIEKSDNNAFHGSRWNLSDAIQEALDEYKLTIS